MLKKALLAHLRQRRTYRRPKGAAAHPGGHIVDAVSIRERPATVEDRAVPGHWEGDLLVGARNSYIATLVERRSRYVCLVRVTGKEPRTGVRALTRHVQRLPEGLMTTLTWDRGLELAAHRTFSIATGVQVYFCDPQSPWQRGTNENTNGLLRQYFRGVRTWRSTLSSTSMQSRCASTPGLARHSATGRQPIYSRKLLHRPVESAPKTRSVSAPSSAQPAGGRWFAMRRPLPHHATSTRVGRSRWPTRRSTLMPRAPPRDQTQR